jgi:hypothetical protein
VTAPADRPRQRPLRASAALATPRVVLEGAACRLAERLLHLEQTLDTDDAAWGEYIATASALADTFAQIEPGRGGELLTTAEMAGRLGITPKTLLRHKATGSVKPAVQRGKLIRWRGDEITR